jgi:hypothetical protein
MAAAQCVAGYVLTTFQLAPLKCPLKAFVRSYFNLYPCLWLTTPTVFAESVTQQLLDQTLSGLLGLGFKSIANSKSVFASLLSRSAGQAAN